MMTTFNTGSILVEKQNLEIKLILVGNDSEKEKQLKKGIDIFNRFLKGELYDYQLLNEIAELDLIY